MKKRLISMLLTAGMLVSLVAGCGSKAETPGASGDSNAAGTETASTNGEYPVIRVPSGSEDRQSLYHRPRNRCRDRRYKHHREQCQIISGCHPGSKKLPAGCRRKTDQRYPPPPDTGRQCHSLLQRYHPWKNHYRKRRNRRRKYLGNGKHSRRSKNCTDKSKEIKSINYI